MLLLFFFLRTSSKRTVHPGASGFGGLFLMSQQIYRKMAILKIDKMDFTDPTVVIATHRPLKCKDVHIFKYKIQ